MKRYEKTRKNIKMLIALFLTLCICMPSGSVFAENDMQEDRPVKGEVQATEEATEPAADIEEVTAPEATIEETTEPAAEIGGILNRKRSMKRCRR